MTLLSSFFTDSFLSGGLTAAAGLAAGVEGLAAVAVDDDDDDDGDGFGDYCSILVAVLAAAAAVEPEIGTAPDKVHKNDFDRLYLFHFFTKSYV